MWNCRLLAASCGWWSGIRDVWSVRAVVANAAGYGNPAHFRSGVRNGSRPELRFRPWGLLGRFIFVGNFVASFVDND